jgi:hypothetical protein
MRMIVRTALAAAALVVLAATPAWAATPSGDLQAGADGAVGPVGSTRTIYLHLSNQGPDDLPAGSVTEEFRAPAGAILIGVGGAKGGPPIPATCTWLAQDTDIQCIHQARLAVSPMSVDIELTFKIVSTITAPGLYLVACRAGLCVDPDTKNNTASIVVNGVIHGPTPTPTGTPTRSPSPSPTPSGTPSASATPSRSPSATPTRSTTPSPSRTSPSPSPSSVPTDGGAAPGAGPGDPDPGLTPPPDHHGGFGLDGIVWTVLGGTLVLAAGAALLLMRRQPSDRGEDTDDLGGLLGP